jgi:hypothetical protein
MLVVIFATSLAYGSTARVRSMAGAGTYMSDDSDVFRWYSTLPSYANMIQAEIGTWGELDFNSSTGLHTWDQYGSPGFDDGRGLSINHACGEDGKYGTYRISLLESSIDHSTFHVVNPVLYMGTPDFITDNPRMPFSFTPVNKWDFGGGWEVNENVSAGLAVTRSSWSWETVNEDPALPDGTEWKADFSFTTVGVGGSWSNNEDLVVDAAFTYGFAGGEFLSPQVGDTTLSYEWDSKAIMDIAARGFYDWKEGVTVVPVLEFTTANYALKKGPTDWNHALSQNDAGDKISNLLIGVGLNMDVNDDNTVIFAVEFDKFSWEPSNPDTFQTKVSRTALPTLRLALETQITSWLTTRIGAAHHSVRHTLTNDVGDETKYTNNASGWEWGAGFMTDYQSYFEWTLGAGFEVAEWTIDMELAPETPFGIGYWLTGYTPWPDFDGDPYWAGPVYRMSGTYNF